MFLKLFNIVFSSFYFFQKNFVFVLYLLNPTGFLIFSVKSSLPSGSDC